MLGVENPSQATDDLVAVNTEGYKVSAKKTLDELANLDAEDESLRRWKESLGIASALNASVAAAGDDRNVVVTKMIMSLKGRDDVELDLSGLAYKGQDIDLGKTVVIKEGSTYSITIQFLVKRDLISGLKYLHAVKRKGIPLETRQEMIGTFSASTTAHIKKFAPEDAPSGFIARGKYDIKSKFVDDDNVTHLVFKWAIEIKKGWQ